MELSMSNTTTVSPLRQRMIEDMAARKLNPHTQRSHISSCKRFAAWLKRSPDTATPDEVRRFQLHLVESGASICDRNRIMTGVRFLFRVARIGITAVLHTWGSALTHHPHVHMIVPGGGISLDGAQWVASRSNFLVRVNVLARLFRGKMLAMLMDAYDAGQLKFFNTHAGLADKRTFKR
jgi:Putative transposase/Phage integrase, N-terminal SAM-like domain